MTAGDAPSTPHGIEVGGRGQGWVRSRAMSRCLPPEDRAPVGTGECRTHPHGIRPARESPRSPLAQPIEMCGETGPPPSSLRHSPRAPRPRRLGTICALIR